MANIFSSILQTYLYFKNQNARHPRPEGDDVWPEEFPLLGVAWQPSVELLETKSKEGDFEFEDRSADVGCVGYKVGEKQFWIPAPLTTFLPEPSVMEALYDAAEERKLFSGSSICVSGSSVLMGVVPRVGDLDLFEYVDEKAHRAELLATAPKYRVGSVICTEVMVGTTDAGRWPTMANRWEITQDEISHEKMRVYAAKYLDKHDFCKIDMIGSFGDHVGEITNVVFKHEQGFDFATRPFPSFTFQEIIARESCPEPGRYSLKNYGDYVFWLADEVEKGIVELEPFVDRDTLPGPAKKVAIKISKRAMLLAAMIGEAKFTDWFSQILANKESREYAVKSAISCIAALIDEGAEGTDLAQESLAQATEELIVISKLDSDPLVVADLVSELNDLMTCLNQMCYPLLNEVGELQVDTQT
jgi:hypothetical protein